MQQQNPEIPVREKQGSREQGTHQGPYFEPSVDIFETEDALTVRADIPGAEAGDIDTDVRDNLLTLTARVRPLDSKWRPLREEYTVGHYVRQFRLGQQIDQSRISAQLKDGVLTLTLPKADHARPRRIQVQAG
jgi:HSP20 family protein